MKLKTTKKLNTAVIIKIFKYNNNGIFFNYFKFVVIYFLKIFILDLLLFVFY